MKILNKLAKDFMILSTSDKCDILILIGAVCLIFNVYPKIYSNQDNPCQIMNTFLSLPLPSKEYVHIIPDNYSKLSVFSITCNIYDPSKSYEDVLSKYLINSDYKHKRGESLFQKNGVDLVMKRYTYDFRFSLSIPVKGVFDHE